MYVLAAILDVMLDFQLSVLKKVHVCTSCIQALGNKLNSLKIQFQCINNGE